MRIPILSACGAALVLAALPAAGHGWSPRDEDGGLGERHCPILQPSHSSFHHFGAPGGLRRHPRSGGDCPFAAGAPGHYAYERVHTPDRHVGPYAYGRTGMGDRRDWAYGYGPARGPGPGGWSEEHERVRPPEQRDWSYEDDGSWRRDRRAWSDGDWSGRMAERGGFGCRDANGPEAYRDRDGGHRAAPDFGMRCHDDGMHRDHGYARWGGAFGYSREADSQWSSSEHAASWGESRGWSRERPSMTDRYGFLTWPGKTHFLRGQAVSDAPAAAPEGQPDGSWQVYR